MRPTLLMLAACAGDDPTPPPPAPVTRDNVLVITLDTTRADALPAYGNTVAVTPTLDRLAAEGTRFSRAYTVTPLTIPAHSSLFTGQYPPHHGVRDNGDFFLGPEAVTLAEQLQGAGYATFASVGAEVTSHHWGFSQGFDAFHDDMGEAARDEENRWRIERRGDAVVDDALATLEPLLAGERPWFGWVHLFDVHHPYAPPEPYASRFPGQPYLGELAFADAQVGRLIDKLDQTGTLDKTWVILLADHGEGMGSHGEVLHGVLLYNATVRIPLVVRPPRGRAAPAYEHFPVSIVDVAPTVLSLVGADPLPAADGLDLSPWVDPDAAAVEAPTDRAVYVESLYAWRHYGWSSQRAVVTTTMKLIDSTTPELYLRDDYPEAANRAADRPTDVTGLQGVARDLTARLQAAGGASARDTQLDDTQLAQLEALGYVTASAHAPGDGDGFDQGLPDPVARLPVLQDVDKARQAVQSGDLDAALARLDEVLAEEPGLGQPRMMRAQVLMRKGDRAAARAQLEALAADHPSAMVEIQLGVLDMEAGRADAALARFEAALAMEPYLDAAWRPYLRALASLGRLEALDAALARAAERRPNLGTAAVLRALRAVQRGELGAEAQLRAAVDAHPDEPGGNLAVGQLDARKGDFAAAEARLLAEVAAVPRDPTPRKLLVEHYARQRDYAAQLLQIDGVLPLAPRDATLVHARAVALFNLGRYDESLAATTDCLQLDPRSANCKLMEANALKKLGRNDDAQAAFEAARAWKASE